MSDEPAVDRFTFEPVVAFPSICETVESTSALSVKKPLIPSKSENKSRLRSFMVPRPDVKKLAGTKLVKDY